MRVVITGASRGIGRATALKLASDGAEAMTLCDVAYLDELEELATSLRTSGCKVRTLKADMAKPTEPAKVIAAAVKAMGGIDALVGNAGITAPSKLVDLDLATWNRVFDINLRANWLLAKAAHPHLKRSKGAIVMLASMAGVVPQLPTGAYSPTKAALINLAETLYIDLAPLGIGVSVVNPGFVETPLTAQNTFRMPALITPAQAAEAMLAGWAAGDFEMNFPKRFTLWLRAMRWLPDGLYFSAIRKATGL